MENISNLKIFGSGSDEEKAKIEELISKRLNDNRSFIPEKELDRLRATEYPKGDLENTAIDFSNQYTAKLMEKAGVPNFDIPKDNYYIVPTQEYSKVSDNKNSSGTAKPSHKVIALNAEETRGRPLYMAAVILHETIHLKSFLSMELNKGEEAKDRAIFRDGFVVRSSKKVTKKMVFPIIIF